MVQHDSEEKPLGEEDGSEASLTRRRKIEHIEICLDEDVQCRVPSMFTDIEFLHNALPEIDKDNIDLTTTLLGLKASAPIIIAAMTGGHPQTLEINRRLAQAAEELKIPIGVGSQRAAIEDSTLADTFKVVREEAPSVPIIANIGATHVKAAQEAIEMINADIIAIHLNPLQEAVQPEGDCNSIGVLGHIRAIVESVDIPVMVKETGAGMSGVVARSLEEIGVDAVDVGGVGGTSWAAVEYFRAVRDGDEVKIQLGHDFWDWGIPTALSVIMVVDATGLDVIATGGIRTGLDVAKSLSLGAVAAGVAHPLLKPAVRGTVADVIDEVEKIVEGLKVAMYLTGCETLEELKTKPMGITGDLLERLQSFGIDHSKYTRM